MMKRLIPLALTAMLLSACGSSSPEEAVTAFFEDVQNGHVIQAATAIKGGNLQTIFAASQLNLPITDEQRDILFTSIENVYAFDNVELLEENGDLAKVQADVTTIHLAKAATTNMAAMPELLLSVALGSVTKEEAIKRVIDRTVDELDVEHPPTTTFTVTLTLEKDGNDYEIIPNDELIKALVGNIGLAELFE